MSSELTLTIGQLAKATGVSCYTIRYYERRGLLPRPRRTAGGFRRYGPDTVQTIQIIRECRDLGFKLTEIRKLLDLRGRTSLKNHSSTRTIFRQKIEALENEIARMSHSLELLKDLLRHDVLPGEGSRNHILERLGRGKPEERSSR